MAQSMGRNRDLINAMKFGFWIRHKQTRRAVRWEPQRHPDGRESMRGRGWVEVLAHGETREPERYFAIDVELAGPHDRMAYYPATHEPVCGWQEPDWIAQGEFCPRHRETTAEGGLEPFCRRHMTELLGSEGEESNAGEDVSHPE